MRPRIHFEKSTVKRAEYLASIDSIPFDDREEIMQTALDTGLDQLVAEYIDGGGAGEQ